MIEKKHVYAAEREQFTDTINRWGEPRYRGEQIWTGLYKGLVSSFDEISTLPQELVGKLQTQYDFHFLDERARARSGDGNTLKILFDTRQGDQVETVLMTYARRNTVCISTQSGCAMGCVFCATGQMGFVRNLSPGEIVEQVMVFARHLKEREDRLTNIVVMGMGEPFHNYEATIQAMDTLNHPEGFCFGARRITISTVGLTPIIERFTDDRRREKLAVSLHAATQDLRDELLPISARYPLDELLQACEKYVHVSGRRITFEWALIHDVNDSLEQATAFVQLAKGINCHVNLIPMNPTAGYAKQASPIDQVDAFSEVISSAGIPCTVRVRRGIDIAAGCGQLASESAREKKKEAPG